MSPDRPTECTGDRSRLLQPPARRRLEAWLWTGPLGHLLGGSLDFVRALTRYLLARARGRAVR